jgi:WASH complex subunit strumpellin
VEYVRKVLQVIPSTMFQTLDEIISLQTTRLKELPSRVEKQHLKKYAY